MADSIHGSSLPARLRRGKSGDRRYSCEVAAGALRGQPPESWADGQVARARGDKQKALAVFAAARKKMDATWGDKPKDEEDFEVVARLDAGLGRKEDAIREARRAVDLMPIAKDSLMGSTRRQPGAGLRVDRRARPRARATRNCRDDPGRPDIRRSPLQSVLGFFAR